MEYPVQTQRRKVLEYLHRRRRGKELKLEVRDRRVEVFGSMGSGEVVNYELGFGPRQFDNFLRELRDEGYIAAELKEPGLFFGSYNIWTIRHLTDKGLREIGELPDPHFELMQRLDLAIQQIQQDPRLSETQKQQTINWLEEGKIVARTLTLDAIKAILAGAIP